MLPPSWRLLSHETLPSTQTLCRQLAEAGEPDGLAILARRQTEGRGTHGRPWESPAGNLFLSVLLRPGNAARQAGLWGMVAALAILDSLAPLVAGLRLKWPNDVLCQEAKIAGVLTEAAASEDRLDWVVLGLGVNLATAPDVPGRLTACVGERAPDPEVFAHAVLAQIDVWRQRVLLEGFAAVRAAWLSHGPAQGAHVTLRHDGRTVGGAFSGLSDEGALLLATGGRITAFAAGET